MKSDIGHRVKTSARGLSAFVCTALIVVLCARPNGAAQTFVPGTKVCVPSSCVTENFHVLPNTITAVAVSAKAKCTNTKTPQVSASVAAINCAFPSYIEAFVTDLTLPVLGGGSMDGFNAESRAGDAGDLIGEPYFQYDQTMYCSGSGSSSGGEDVPCGDSAATFGYDSPPPQPGECLDEPVQCAQGSWSFQLCRCVKDSSPIIIDLRSDGLHLTDLGHGVKFDIDADGNSELVSWTALGQALDDAFLVLDRNGNGMIDSGTELFGDVTSQPASESPNGFAALSVFDRREAGGNPDGVIDVKDKVFSSLRLWIDLDHDGVSQPNELYTLQALGVSAISLDYKSSSRRDRYGNLLLYRTRVVAEPDPIERWAYDVFLVSN